MRSRLLRNKFGVEGIPFKLIIIIVILAISLPIAFDRFNHWDADKTEKEIRNEITNLVTRIKMAYLSGVGNVDTVDVDFRDGATTRVDAIIFGANPNAGFPEVVSISYTIEGITQTILVQDPEIPMAEFDGGEYRSLAMGGGKHSIRISIERDSRFELGRGIDLFANVSVVG